MKQTIKQIIKPALIILAMVLITVITGSVISITLFSTKKISMTIFEVNNIQLQAVSSSRGTTHDVLLSLYFELSDGLRVQLSPKRLKRQLSKMLSTLDYDELASGDGMAYVENYIMSELSDDINRQEVGGVFITKMVTGPFKFFIPLDEQTEDDSDVIFDVRAQQNFNGLFKNTDY